MTERETLKRMQALGLREVADRLDNGEPVRSFPCAAFCMLTEFGRRQ